MIIYNVTVSVENSIRKDWIKWMKETHIPEVINTGCFTEAKFQRLVTDKNDENTFAIAYSCKSLQTLKKYQSHYAADLQAKHIKRYRDRALAFRTVLEVLSEFRQ
tara:strand:+ start:1668 stop:1982 length:315 start_codon:yes stop_codon:yes gene_type:complete